MGTPGVKWTAKKVDIVESLKKNKGRLTYTAKSLNVCFETLKKRIDADPELIELVSSLRNEFETLLLDCAEDCLIYALVDKENDKSNAISAAKYVLNNKGKERGYSPYKSEEGSTIANDVRAAIIEIREEQRIRSAQRSSLEDKQSLLDKELGGTKAEIRAELGSESIMGGDA